MKSLQNHIQESLINEGTNAKLSKQSALRYLDDFLESEIGNILKDDKEGQKLAKSINSRIMNDDFDLYDELTIEDKANLFIVFYEAGRMNHPHATPQINSVNKAIYDWCKAY